MATPCPTYTTLLQTLLCIMHAWWLTVSRFMRIILYIILEVIKLSKTLTFCADATQQIFQNID